VINGGMESFVDYGGAENEPPLIFGPEIIAERVPSAWEATGRVVQDTARGRVHSGDSSVAMYNGSTLTQTIPIEGGCFYEFSFFGHGEGNLVGMTATVTFLPPVTNGLTITIRQGDLPNSTGDFSYYRGLTTQSPATATEAIIHFAVTSNGGQYLDLDDVSFSVQ